MYCHILISCAFCITRAATVKKVKLKSSLWFVTKHHAMKAYWRVKYSSTHPLTSALDGGEWSASRPGRFTPKERVPGTHWTGGRVGPRAVLDAVVKRKIPSPRRESKLEPRLSSSKSHIILPNLSKRSLISTQRGYK
jgi:hypothetical protein